MAFRARPADLLATPALEAAIGRSGATSAHRPVFAMLDGDLAGLAPRRPQAERALVAIGPAVPLAQIAASYSEASAAFETAAAFGIAETVELGDLGPLPLALARGLAAERLAERHLSPLAEQDRHHEIERTMLALIDRDQDVRATAAALHVHPNTVRYRETRFRELTGLDVRRTDDLIVTWWLLKRRAARPAEG
jgi:DNA-binding PucR family transcriptional regulator